MLAVSVNRNLDTLLLFMLIIRIMWIVSIFSHFVDKRYFHGNNEEFILEFEDILHNIFTFFIGIMLIYLYNHLTDDKVCISGKPKKYLYSFGILSCIGILQKYVHKYFFTQV